MNSKNKVIISNPNSRETGKMIEKGMTTSETKTDMESSDQKVIKFINISQTEEPTIKSAPRSADRRSASQRISGTMDVRPAAGQSNLG